MTRNFFEMILRARGAPTFSHHPRPHRTRCAAKNWTFGPCV